MQWYQTPGDVNCFAYLFTYLLMYGSGYTSLCDSEALVSYILSNKQSKEMYCNFSSLFRYLSDGLYIRFDSKPLKMIWELTQIFLQILWHWKVTQPFLCFWVNQVHMFLVSVIYFISSPRWIFIWSPVGLLISPMENLLLGFTPEDFWKFDIFPRESSSPHWGTETGCIQYIFLF